MSISLLGHVFPPRRSHVQIRRGVGYVNLCRLQQLNSCTEEVPCPTNKGVSYNKIGVSLDCDIKNRLLLFLENEEITSTQMEWKYIKNPFSKIGLPNKNH